MYETFEASRFKRHETDSKAVQWYLRRSMASRKVDSSDFIRNYYKELETYMAQNDVPSEENMDIQNWKQFSVLMANRFGIGNGVSSTIESNIDDILYFRQNGYSRKQDQSISDLVPKLFSLPITTHNSNIEQIIDDPTFRLPIMAAFTVSGR